MSLFPPSLQMLTLSQLEEAWSHLYQGTEPESLNLKAVSPEEWEVLESLLLWVMLQKEESSLH